MGTNQTKNGKQLNTQISRNNFEFLYVIGKGGFGKVWKVTFKRNNKYYALKEMSKVKILDRKSDKSIKNERDLLSKLKNDFIVNMIYSFQDYENLYLVMDLLTGGDMRYHLARRKSFTETETKFFICCILLGLEYIHENKVIHRDIKPENLVLDETGYLRITDFGVAKYFTRENSNETSGTPGYMSPEVMCSQNHSYAVDLFAVGVIGYEFMFGCRPYYAKSRREIKELILAKQVQIKKSEIPEGWSLEAADFINKLIQRKPINRLGYLGIQIVKSHPWLEDFPWDDLKNRKLQPPFIPTHGDNFDKKYCETPDKISNDTYERYQSFYRKDYYLDIFLNYTFCDQEEKEKLQKLFLKKKHSPSLSSLNEPAHLKKTKQNQYSASIDISTNMRTINVDKTTNNFNITNLHSFRDTIQQNEPKGMSFRSTKRQPVVIFPNYKTPVPSKKFNEKLPLIYTPVINKSKSKEKIIQYSNVKINPSNFLTIKNNKYGTISSNSTGSSNYSLNPLQKKSRSQSIYDKI